MRSFLVGRLGIASLLSLVTGMACSGEDDGASQPLPGSGGIGAVGGGISAGAPPAVGGSAATGGASVVGATLAGGASTTTSSSSGGAATGGQPSIGETTAKGGSSSIGGTTAKGGSSSIGGTTAKGGSSSIGGTSAKGGSSSIGGTSAKGGSSSIGGTSAKGGSSSIGGTTTASTASDGCTDTLASGITLSEVAVFQTGKISVMKSGAAVTAVSANGGQIINGRPSLFRAYVATDSGFAPRQLSARLTLNGTTYYAKQNISGSSAELTAANSFQISVPGSAMTSNPSYSLKIVECATGSGTAHNPQFPSSGTVSLATRTTGVIKIVIVPMKTGSTTPNLTSLRTSVKAHIEAQFPTYDAQISVHATAMNDCGLSASTAGDGNTWSDCLDAVRARRSADAPANDVYYMGVALPASSFNTYCDGGCINGISYVVEDATGNWAGSSRALMSTGFIPEALDTITHELGHTHGLYHSPGCGADGADTAFPYVTNGKAYIGWVGWDNRNTNAFLDPAKHTDLMAYCEPPWVSDYIYAKLANRIAALNGSAKWVNAEPKQAWRVLNVIGGIPKWGTAIAEPTPAFGKPETGTVFDAAGNALVEVTVYRTEISNSLGAMYIVPEPEAGWATLGIGTTEVAF